MRTGIVLATVVFFLAADACGQSLPFECHSLGTLVRDCSLHQSVEPATFTTQPSRSQIDAAVAKSFYDSSLSVPDFAAASRAAVNPFDADVSSPEGAKQGFHWGRALTESFTLLVIEQAYVVHTDFRWVVTENGIPFNHYWRDYMQSLSEWTRSGWDDGDPNWFGYIGHPIQGALTGFIQIQNDPKSEKLEFSNTKAYWKSRLKAALWNAAYSTQWNLGPLSEVTVEKYGTKARPPWNSDGSYPCNTKHCYTGVGQIDVVMTPIGGTAWLIGEDFLDKKVVERIEASTQNHLLIDTARVAFNPIRAGANMLHGKHPWYRASRDDRGMSFLSEPTTAVATVESSTAPGPNPSASSQTKLNSGNLSFGYTHTGVSHCEVVISVATTPCDALSSSSSDLSGWRVALEKMYLRYFGAVADFSGQYGGATQNNFLFGLRGGAEPGRFRPFAQVLFGLASDRKSPSAGSFFATTFAEDLGVGIDFRLTRQFSWRNQMDELKTGSDSFKRRNLLVSSGCVVRF
jgi:hypothetical protein